jgi:chemotaxis protein MotB
LARKKKHEDHVNHEAWAIPYGDLVTLLLAFFVVMYAMSSVNEGKYRVLSDSLVAAFRSTPKSLEPIQVGQPSKSKHELQTSMTRTLVPLEVESNAGRGSSKAGQGSGAAELGASGELRYDHLRNGDISEEQMNQAAGLIEDLMGALAKELGGLVDQDLVRLRQDRYWLEIEINTSVLFESASVELSPEAKAVLQHISAILGGTPTRVMVEGHTDDRPISTMVYPSNWELSAARAANVVRLFESAGMEPARMGAVGFGEYRPVEDNATPEGQRRNRRIVIAVVAYQPDGERTPWNGLGASSGTGAAASAPAGDVPAEGSPGQEAG